MTQPSGDDSTVDQSTAHGLFGPGIFGTGIDLSALDETTAWRLGMFFDEQLAAARMAARAEVRAELLAIAAEEDAAQIAYFRESGHTGAYHLTASEIADRITPEVTP